MNEGFCYWMFTKLMLGRSVELYEMFGFAVFRFVLSRKEVMAESLMTAKIYDTFCRCNYISKSHATFTIWA